MPQNTRTPQSKRYRSRLGLEELPPMAITQKDGKVTYITKDEYKQQYLTPWLTKLNQKDPHAYDSTQMDHVKYAKSVGYISPAEYTQIANKYTGLIKDLRSRLLTQDVNGKQYGVQIAGPDGVYRNATGADLIVRNKAGEAPFVKFAGFPANAQEFEALGTYNAGIREGRSKEIKSAPKPSTGIAKATNDWVSPLAFKEFAKDVAVPVLGAGKTAIEAISRTGNEIDRALDLPTDPYYDPPQQLTGNFGDRVTAFSEGMRGGVGAAGAEVQNVAEKAPGIAQFRQFAYGGPEWANAVNQSSAETFLNNTANQYPGNEDYGRGLITGKVGAQAAFTAATGIAGMNVAGSLGARALAGIGKEALGRGIGIGVHVASPMLAQIAQQQVAPNQHNITDAVGWLTNAPEQALHTFENPALRDRMSETDPTGQYTKSVHTMASMAMFGGGATGFISDVKDIAKNGIRAFSKLSANQGPITSAKGALSIAGRSLVARQVGSEAAFGLTGPLQTAGQALVSRMADNPDMAPTPQDWATSIIGSLFATRPSKMMGAAFHSNPLVRLDVGSMAYSRAYESVHGQLDKPASLVELEVSKRGFKPDKTDVKKVVHEMERINNELIRNVVDSPENPSSLPKPFNDTVTLIKRVLEANRTGDWTGLESFESTFNDLFYSVRRAKYRTRDSVANPLDDVKLTGRYTQDKAEARAIVQARAKELRPVFERLLLGDKAKNPLPELEKGKQYYGIPLDDNQYMVFTRDFRNPRIIKGEVKDFDADGDKKDIQLVDVHGGKFTSEADKNALDLTSEITKHRVGISNLIGNSFDIDGEVHVFQGIAPNGEAILTRNGEFGSSIVRMPLEKLEGTTYGFTPEERQAIQFLKKYSTGEEFEPHTATTVPRGYRNVNPDYPTEIPISEFESFIGRLIHNDNGLGIYQTPDGSLLVSDTVKSNETVNTPIGTKRLEADAIKHDRSFDQQIHDHPESSGGLFLLNLANPTGTESQYVIRLSADHVDALKELLKNWTGSEDQQDAWQAIIDNALHAEGVWQSKRGPTTPEIGDIVTMRDNDKQKFVVVADPTRNSVLVKPVDNVEHPSYYLNANDVYVNKRVDRRALERMNQNLEHVIGINANAVRPPSNGLDSEFIQAIRALAGNNGGSVIVDADIVGADSETLSTALHTFASKDQPDTNVTASILESLRHWMKKNPDGADIAVIALDGAIGRAFPNNETADFMPFHYLMNAVLDSKFSADVAYLAEKSIMTAGVDADVLHIDSLYSASSPARRDLRALMYSHARQLNNLLFNNDKLTERIINSHINRLAKRIGLTDANEINEFAQKVRSVSGLLRSVHPMMHEAIMDGSIPDWFVNRIAGLPADMQIEALAFKRNAEGKFEAGKTGNALIDGFTTEAGFDSAVKHIAELIASEIASGASSDNLPIRRLLYGNDLGFLYEYAANPEAVGKRNDVKQRLRSHAGIAEARQFKQDATQSVVRSYRQRAAGALVDLVDRVESGEGVPLKDLIVAGAVSSNGDLVAVAPEGKVNTITAISDSAKEIIDAVNNSSAILPNMTSVESLGGMIQVTSMDDLGGQVRRAKTISRTDVEAREALLLAQQLDPSLLSKLMVFHGAMKNIIDSARTILKINDADAIDDLILAFLYSNNEAESLRFMFKDDEQYERFIRAATDIGEKRKAQTNEDVDTNAARAAGATGSLGTYNTARSIALEALSKLTDVETISTTLVERMRASNPSEEADLIQAQAWNWATLAQTELIKALAKNVSKLSTNNNELTDMLNGAMQTALNIKDQVRMAGMSSEFGASHQEFLKAVRDGAANATSFFGHRFDPDVIPMSLSQAFAKGTAIDDGMGPIEAWDLIRQKATEMARHLEHIGRTGQEYDPNDPLSALAEKLMTAGLTKAYADPNAPVPVMVAYNRGGLERVLQLHLLAEAQREHGDLADIVISKSANDETTELYNRNVQAAKSASALRSSYLSQTKNGSIAVAMHPENIGQTAVELHPDVKARATTGQLLFNHIYDVIKRNGKNLNRLEANVKDLLQKAPKTRDVAIIKYADIVALARLHGVELDVVMQPTIDGKGFSAPVGATSPEALPHRIVSVFAGLISHDLMRQSVRVPDSLARSFPNVNWNKEAGHIISGLDIFSILPHLKDGSLQGNVSLGTFTQLRELYSALMQHSKDNYSADELEKIGEIRQLLTQQINKTESGGVEKDSSDYKSVARDREHAAGTAKSIAALVDRFAVGAAFRALDYDIHSNANRNKYFALAIAAGMPEAQLQQMFANNVSVRQLLTGEAIGDYSGPLLTKEQTLELQSLRLAQLHQDQYRDNKSLGFISDLAVTAKTDYAEGAPKGFFRKLDRSDMGSLIWLKNLGMRRAEDVSVHEVGHYLFHTLPDYLQVKWMQALNPKLDSQEGRQEQQQAHIRDAYDKVREATRLLNQWELVQNTLSENEKQHYTEFKLPADWKWGTVNQEMTTTGLTNFILNGALVQSRNSSTIDSHAMNILQHLSTRLREAYKLANRSGRIDDAVIISENGPLDAFWYSLMPVEISSPYGEKGQSRLFYPLKHNSYVQFVSPVNPTTSDSGVILNPMASLLGFHNSGGLYDGALSLIPDIDAQNEIKNIMNSQSDLQGIQNRDLIFQFIAGPYKNQDMNSYDPLSRGYVTSGKVVGMAFASNFNSIDQVPSKFKALGWRVDSTGKRRLWVSISREDDNGWYQSAMPYVLNGQQGVHNLFKSDYSYIVETVGTAQLLVADGVNDFGKTKYKVAQRRIDPENSGNTLPSTYKNVAFRYMVPHSAISESRVYGLGTSDYANPTFSEVIYSAISRVSKAIINANQHTDYQHHLDLADVLAKKYGGDNTGIEQYYQSLDDVTAGFNGDWSKRLSAVTPEDSAAINAAQISGWPRTVVNSRQLGQRMRELFPDDLHHEIMSNALEDFIASSRGALLEGDGSERLLKPYTGTPHKLVIGGNPLDASTEANLRGALVLQWMKDRVESGDIGEAFGKIGQAISDARTNGTEIDWASTGLDFTVKVESKTINIESLLDRVFDTSLTQEELNQTIQGLQQSIGGMTVALPTRVTLDHVNRAALNHILSKVFTTPEEQRTFLTTLLRNQSTGSVQDDVNTITAKNIFNSVRHVMAVDSQTRRTALRNWRKWNIHEIDGNSVILRSPSRDIAIRGQYKQNGALVRVDLSNGKIDFVQKTKVFRKDGVREQYVSVMPASMAYKSLATGLKRKLELFGSFRSGERAVEIPLRDLFSGQDAETMLTGLVGPDTFSKLKTQRGSSAVFFLPSTNAERSIGSNDGLVGYKVTRNKDGQLVAKRVSDWWNSNDDFDTQNISAILGIAMQNQDAETRSSVAQRQLYGEAYHIARLLLLKDQLQTRPAFEAPDRINDTPLIETEPRLRLNDVGNLGTGRTWYSIAEPHEQQYFEGFNPDGQIDIFPPANVKRDIDTYVDWATAAAINRGEQYVTRKSQDIAYVPDPSLTDTIGLGRDGSTQIVYLPENMYDAATGLPREDYFLPSQSGPPQNATTALATTSAPKSVAKTEPAIDPEVIDPSQLAPSGPNLPKRTNATGAAKFAIQVLGALKNDAQFLLGMDLSTFGIQMIGRGINDPVGFITSIFGVTGMIMPNREDIPYFVGMAIDRAARLSGNKFGNVGDWHYDWTMQQVLDRYNKLYSTNYSFSDLEKYGWNSSYSSWRRQHAMNTARNPVKYKTLTDTPFDVPDETLSRGILREFFIGAKRFDQTRLLCRDIFALKAGLDVMRNVNNQIGKKPFDIGADLHGEMRNLNLDLGLQTFGNLPGQAPAFALVNGLINHTQNAPSFHRNFVNANPILREISMAARDTVGNTLYRKATKRLNGGWFDGDIYDVAWERKFIEYQTGYAKAKQNSRSVARFFGGLGLVAIFSALQWAAHKSDPEKRGTAFLGNDYLDLTKKQIGYSHIGKDMVFEVLPVSKPLRYLRPIMSLLSPNEPTYQAKFNAFARSAVKTYIESRQGNIASMLNELFQGNEFSGAPSWDTNAGAAILKASKLHYPYENAPSNLLLPIQSNFVTNHFNLVSAQAYYKDAAILAAARGQFRKNVVLHGLLGDKTVSEIPILTQEDIDKLNKMDAARRFGLSGFIEPPMVKKANESIVVDGDMRATLQRWMYLLRNDFFDWSSAAETARKRGYGPIFEGYGADNAMGQVWGVPSSKAIEDAHPVAYPTLPLGGDRGAAYAEVQAQNKPNAGQLIWDDIKRQFGIEEEKKKSNE